MSAQTGSLWVVAPRCNVNDGEAQKACACQTAWPAVCVITGSNFSQGGVNLCVSDKDPRLCRLRSMLGACLRERRWWPRSRRRWPPVTAALASRGAPAACARCTAACAGSTRRTRHTCFPLASTLFLLSHLVCAAACEHPRPPATVKSRVCAGELSTEGLCAVSGSAVSGGTPGALEAEAAPTKPAARLALVFGREESGLQVCLSNHSSCNRALAQLRSCT